MEKPGHTAPAIVSCPSCAKLNRVDLGRLAAGPRCAACGRAIHLDRPLAVTDATFDRSVFAGEAQGRWLWVVLRPASAALLLQDEWRIADISGLGPTLVDLPFLELPRPW